MKVWRIIRWFNIWRGVTCSICHADLRKVATCGICKRSDPLHSPLIY